MVRDIMKNFCEAMRFIWKDWPQPVRVGAGAPRVQDVLLTNETWQLAAQGYHDAPRPGLQRQGRGFLFGYSRQHLSPD